MSMKKINVVSLSCIVIVCFVFCCYIQKYRCEEKKFSCYDITGMPETPVAIELHEGITFQQTIDRPMEEISAICFSLPTYGRHDLEGTVSIKVFDRSVCVASQEIDAATLEDVTDNVCTDLQVKKGHVGDELKIEIVSDCSPGNCVGVWQMKPDGAQFLNPKFGLNGTEMPGITNMSVIYRNNKLSYVWWIFFAVLVACLLSVDSVYARVAGWVKGKNVWRFLALSVVAVAVLSLRGGVFSYSAVFAEDGLYLSNIINKGFLKSCLSTRYGGANDFLNFGSYILLGISWALNKAIYGFNVQYLPVMIGIVSSIFLAAIAVSSYYVFAGKEKILAAACYITVLAIPVGGKESDFTMIIFGRSLNLVFVYPVLAVLGLFLLWRKRYEKTLQNYFWHIIVLVCCLSFPISFAALGVWILLGIYCAICDKKIGAWIKGGGIISIAVLLIGFMLLPVMIGSKGSAGGLDIKADALIEFVIGRHMLYPFVYFFYEKLNDILVMVIFGITVFIIVRANVCECAKNGVINEYFVFTWISIACIAASAMMRLPMSALFDSYSTTGPENYYYGCNILYCMLVLYGFSIVTRQHRKFFGGSMVIFLAMFAMNDNLFPEIENGKSVIIGKTIGVEDWNDCLEEAVSSNRINDGSYTVVVHPMSDDGAWMMKLPGVYVWASVK